MNRSAPLSSTLAALAGVGFAVLLFFSVAVVDPLREATDQELLTWWSDSGKQRDTIISMYAMLIAGPLFLVFLVQLCTRLRSAGQNAASWSGLVFGAGVAFVALIAVTAFSRGVVAQSIRFSDEPIPGPDTLRYATALSQAAFGLGAIPLATMAVAAASVIILRSGVLARWLGWLGIVVAAGSLVMAALLIGALASPLIELWVVAASFVIWRTRHAAAGDAIAAHAGGTLAGPMPASR
ncbi:MAG: hypothetical protein ACR2HN_07950 [Tepidiformaceae bacterium]